jgi:hypothetical protein
LLCNRIKYSAMNGDYVHSWLIRHYYREYISPFPPPPPEKRGIMVFEMKGTEDI